MRFLRLLLLVLALVPVAWSYAPMPPQSADRRILRADLMPGLRAAGVPHLGGVELAGAWHYWSANREFGNYSALVGWPDGTLAAIGDRNDALAFDRPDRAGPWRARAAEPFAATIPGLRTQADAESATVWPDGRTLLVGYEGGHHLVRMTRAFRPFAQISVPALAEWPENRGPEAMARLADGRLVIVGEVYFSLWDRVRHPGFVFATMPRNGARPGRFTLAMPEGFRPVDMAQAPDGRLLVLGRKLTLLGFSTTLLWADSRVIRPGALVPTHEIARITDRRIRENYEGMALTRGAAGGTDIWLISDSNQMERLQRTLLLKLRLTG